MKSIWLLTIFLFVLGGEVLGQGRQEWEANSYPNPTTDGYVRCNMKSPSNICDPDGVLTEAERYRINYELNQLESRTRQTQGSNFCEKKGIVAAVALAKHVRGASENAVKVMANDILRKWTLDKQCSKSLVIMVSTEDKKFWVARDNRVPVYGAEFTDIFAAQKPLFKEGNYPQALLNIIESTWEKALNKQGDGAADTGPQQPFTPGGGGGGGGKHPSGGSRGGDSKGFSFPKIPAWFWIALVLVIIPTLCCCCCLYFCCCRKKDGGGNKRQGPNDLPDEEGYGRGGAPPPRRGFGGGGGMQNILGGMGAGAIGSSISNWFRNRNAGGGAAAGGGVPMGGGGGGGYQPPPGEPGSAGHQGGKGGKGLYPSVEVKDEGGGGAW